MFDCRIKTYGIIPCFSNPVLGQCLGKYILWQKPSDHYKRIHCDFHFYNSNSRKCMLLKWLLFSKSGKRETIEIIVNQHSIFLKRSIDSNLPQGNHWICHCLTICCTFPLQRIWFRQCKQVLVLHHYWLHYRMRFVLAKHQQRLKSSVERGKKTSFYKHPSNALKGIVFAMNLMNCSILGGKIIGWVLIECATQAGCSIE